MAELRKHAEHCQFGVSLSDALRERHKFVTKHPVKATACFGCGKSSHDQVNCWFCDKNCKLCNHKVHIQRMCRMKQNEEKEETCKKDKKVKN